MGMGVREEVIKESAMDLSVIIVNYKTYALTKEAIESVLRSDLTIDGREISCEILMIDNASGDGSVEKLREDFKDQPNVMIIENSENAGYSKANNIGIERARGEKILLLNSDAKVEPSAIGEAVSFLDAHPEVGALGAHLVLGDGVTLDHACKRGFPTPAASFFYLSKIDRLFPRSKRIGALELRYLDPEEMHEVDTTTGAFLMTRRDVLDEVGPLDEDYFLYGEDLDLCYRIRQAGYKIIYHPKVRGVHYKKQSPAGKKNLKALDAFYDSMKIFYDKHYKESYPRVVGLGVDAGVLMMKTAARVKNTLMAKQEGR